MYILDHSTCGEVVGFDVAFSLVRKKMFKTEGELKNEQTIRRQIEWVIIWLVVLSMGLQDLAKKRGEWSPHLELFSKGFRGFIIRSTRCHWFFGIHLCLLSLALKGLSPPNSKTKRQKTLGIRVVFGRNILRKKSDSIRYLKYFDIK